MANPQLDDGFVSIDNRVLDAALRHLSPTEFVVWAALLRALGDRVSAQIRYADLAAACGVSGRVVMRVVSALAARGVLYVRKRGPFPVELRMETDPAKWIGRDLGKSST